MWQVYGGASAPGFYDAQPSIPGWNPTTYQVELQKTGLFGSALSGSQYAEVDAVGQVLLTQNIPTTAGSQYRIRFFYGLRPDAGSQSMGVYWNGQLVGSMGGTPNSSGIPWQEKIFTVTATGGSSLLGFGSTGGTNGAGNFVDNVSVQLLSSNNCQSPGGTDMKITMLLPPQLEPKSDPDVPQQITVTNIGQTTVTGATMTEQIPDGLTYAPGLSPSFCFQSNQNVICNIPPLNPGETAQFIVYLLAPASTPCGSTLSKTVTLNVSGDNNTSNNTSTSSSLITCPGGQSSSASSSSSSSSANSNVDLVTLLDLPPQIHRGSLLPQKITVKNEGPQASGAATEMQSLPAGYVFNSQFSDPRCAGNSCAVPPLASGAETTFWVYVEVPMSYACGTNVTLSATTNLNIGSEADMSDNTGSDTVLITCQ
jgi:hypothetical protein